MRYLAVDKDGTECLSNYKLERHNGQASIESEQLICFDDVDNKKQIFGLCKINLVVISQNGVNMQIK